MPVLLVAKAVLCIRLRIAIMAIEQTVNPSFDVRIAVDLSV